MRTPFVGAAGTALTVILNNLGILRSRVYLTNVVHCNKLDEQGKLMTPDEEDIGKCLTHLQCEIRMVQPKLIIALGNPAMHALTYDYTKKIGVEHGKVMDLHPDFNVPAKVICTYHPSWMIRQKGDDFEKAKTLIWNDLWQAAQLAKSLAPDYDYQKRPLFI